MQRVFEFGEYWDLSTFFLIMIVGVVICFFHYRGTAADNRNSATSVYFGKKKLVKPNIWYILMFFLLLFLYTFKSMDYGADSGTYVSAFLISTSMFNELNEGWELLFILFNFLIRKITDNYTVYFFFAGVIVAYGYVQYIREFWTGTEDSLFLILISVSFFYDLNIMRSGIGGSFLLISLCHLKKDNFGKAIIFSIVAFLFQYTLIVHFFFLIFYYIVNKPNQNSYQISVIRAMTYEILGFILVIGSTYVLKSLLAGTRYAYYYDAMSPTILGNWTIILSAVLAIVALNRRVEDKRISIAIMAALYSFLLIPPVVIIGAYRLTQYHFSIRILLWGWLFSDILRKDSSNLIFRKIIIITMIVFYAVFYLGRRSLSPGFAYYLVDLF